MARVEYPHLNKKKKAAKQNQKAKGGYPAGLVKNMKGLIAEQTQAKPKGRGGNALVENMKGLVAKQRRTKKGS